MNRRLTARYPYTIIWLALVIYATYQVALWMR